LLSTEESGPNGQPDAGELHALCLPVAAEELLHANQLGAVRSCALRRFSFVNLP